MPSLAVTLCPSAAVTVLPEQAGAPVALRTQPTVSAPVTSKAAASAALTVSVPSPERVRAFEPPDMAGMPPLLSSVTVPEMTISGRRRPRR